MASNHSNGYKIYEKYKHLIQGDLETSKKFCYNEKTNKIYGNITGIASAESSVLGFKTNMVKFMHEVGHWLDRNLVKDKTLNSLLPKIQEKGGKDILNYLSIFLRRGSKGNKQNNNRGKNKGNKRIGCIPYK